MSTQIETTSQQPDCWIPPCIRCGRKHSETPLKIDYRGKFHQCVDSLGCVRAIKAKGEHTFAHGAANLNQRRLAFRLAEEKGIDLYQFAIDELGLDDPLKMSSKVMSAIIDAMMQRQIKAKRAA